MSIYWRVILTIYHNTMALYIIIMYHIILTIYTLWLHNNIILTIHTYYTYYMCIYLFLYIYIYTSISLRSCHHTILGLIPSQAAAGSPLPVPEPAASAASQAAAPAVWRAWGPGWGSGAETPCTCNVGPPNVISSLRSAVPRITAKTNHCGGKIPSNGSELTDLGPQNVVVVGL